MFLSIGPFQLSLPISVERALLHPSFLPFLSLKDQGRPAKCTVHICSYNEWLLYKQQRYSYSYTGCHVALDKDGLSAVIAFDDCNIVPNDISKAVAVIISMLLLMKFGIILHSAAVIYENKAVVFSADSGTGKSTQARLWEDVLGANIINHDKPMLFMQDGSWIVSGTPWSGEDPCYKKIIAPLCCIVFLSQGSENEVTIPNTQEKISFLSRQLRLCVDFQDWYESMLRIIGKMVQDIPMIKYSCTMESTAATDLLTYLQREGWL